MYFTEEELVIIKGALHTAADTYEKDAELCEKHRHQILYDRVVTQFRKQAREAQALAEKIGEEHGL